MDCFFVVLKCRVCEIFRTFRFSRFLHVSFFKSSTFRFAGFKWVGEWIALLSCVVACIIFILYFISFDSESLTLGWNYGCYCIATGFVLSFVFRLIAERMRAVASIANNTKQFKRKMKVVKNDNFEYQGLLNNFLYFVAIAVTLAYTLTALFE